MATLSALYDHAFLKAVVADGDLAFKSVNIDNVGVYLPDDIVLDEYQFYLHNVGFYLVHTLTWCRQLDLAVEFLSAFDYSKNLTATRADHLIFNIENYFVRLRSVHDRALQLVNAVFHLCINEEHVGHSVVISNYKVTHRPEIVAIIKAVKKFLGDYEQSRHTLIHRHSYLDADLKRVERLYLAALVSAKMPAEQLKRLKAFRARCMSDFVRKKKAEFSAINSTLATHIDSLFTALQGEYDRQKKALV